MLSYEVRTGILSSAQGITGFMVVGVIFTPT